MSKKVLTYTQARKLISKWKKNKYKGVTLKDLKTPVRLSDITNNPIVFVLADVDPRCPLFNNKDVLKYNSYSVARYLAAKVGTGLLSSFSLPKAMFDPDILKEVACILADADPDIELPEQAYFYESPNHDSVAHIIARKSDSIEALLRIPDKALSLKDFDGVPVAHYLADHIAQFIFIDPDAAEALCDKLLKPDILRIADDDGKTVVDRLRNSLPFVLTYGSMYKSLFG